MGESSPGQVTVKPTKVCTDGGIISWPGNCETYQEPGSKQTERASQDSASSPLVPILVPVLVITIIIIIIIAVILLCRWRRRHQRKGPNDEALGVNLIPGREDTDLIVACTKGKLQRVRDILGHSIDDINKKGKEGLTPVMWAARRGHRELVDLLVKKSADVKRVDDIGNNILHWACVGGHVAMVKHVASKNIGDTNCRGRYGRTPLMYVARQGNKDMFHLLVSKGGLPSQVDTYGNNILHLACWGGNV
ncbi:palmitoyltransferase AKR1-like isoform X2 [Haliotis rubra]|uniref:palmitoyltransferase AKR1-like isoform X2 n=1 Tax=Haliotis rubra TaxID=36100 RepID=UPI001EE510A3|nr:palmitoyltransferase AKR1-like isoform X2 [Haliotis rubra]XP_046578802.1 palmitoyltransferase AKR1-like isoform X2 [Haliotis rubra]